MFKPSANDFGKAGALVLLGSILAIFTMARLDDKNDGLEPKDIQLNLSDASRRILEEEPTLREKFVRSQEAAINDDFLAFYALQLRKTARELESRVAKLKSRAVFFEAKIP